MVTGVLNRKQMTDPFIFMCFYIQMNEAREEIHTTVQMLDGVDLRQEAADDAEAAQKNVIDHQDSHHDVE